MRKHTEFNYRTQVHGETTWERIKTLNGFLDDRKRAAVLEEVDALKYQAKASELKFLQENCGAEHVILNLRAEIMELDSWQREQDILYREVHNEIECIERLLKELYALVNPFRPDGYTDEMMYELNAVNEYTVMIARDVQSEIIANGKPTAASVRHALNNPTTFYALQKMGLMPIDAQILVGSDDPQQIELTHVERVQISHG